MQKIASFVNNAVKYLYTILMFMIVVLCFTCKEGTYYTQKAGRLSNILCTLLGLSGVLLLSIVIHLLAGKIKVKDDKSVMLWLNAFLGGILLFSSYHYYFRTGWDAGVVIQEAVKIAEGRFPELWNFYFDRCYNNIFITVIFSWVIRAGRLLPFGNDYLYLVMLQCVIWAYTGYLLYCVASQLFEQKRTAFLVWMVYVVLVGMSPWVAVPYTDTAAMPVVITLLYLWLKGRISFFFGFLTIVGYFIKPQVVILVIALALMKVVDTDIERKRQKKFGKQVGWLAAGLAVGWVLAYAGQTSSHIVITGEDSFGIPHYLMLGLNEETDGIFSDSDFLFSQSFSTKAERNQANLQEINNRLKNMGAMGLMRHLKNKLLVAYEDGTFAWGSEGGFFTELYYSGLPALREKFREFYIPEGKNYKLFLNLEQCCWMAVLFLATFTFTGNKKDKRFPVLALSVIGATLFEMLFEVRARHLFLYIPIFLLLMGRSVERLTANAFWASNRNLVTMDEHIEEQKRYEQ